MLPVITTLSMVFSFLLGANVLVEKVFAWPGIGTYCGGGPDRIRRRTRPAIRADQGGDVRRSQSADRHPLRRDRSARQAGRVGGAHKHRCADRRTRGSRPNLRACRSVRADPLCAEREQGHRLRLRAADPDPVRCVVRALCGAV
ncbi:hypothetical protein [Pantoea stewartii]|uniref:hypothetical protein n=1 Tax=Pantoea stewartii TaxID=66269 RepID=UPI003B97DDDF